MNNEYKISGIILCGVVVALFLIPSFQADTIFLVNEQGGTPESCVGNNGLVLAQNITDLCDVTVITPLTNQILRYNGSQWINVNSTAISESTVCVNVGTGTAFSCVEGTNVNLRSLLAGTGISISNNSNTITITNISPESTDCTLATLGINIVKTSSGGDCVFRALTNTGGGITIIEAADTISFGSFCDNTGTGQAVCETGNDINSLIAGNSLTITDTTGDLTITPTLQKLCEATASGGETTLTCTLSSSQQILYFSINTATGSDTTTVYRLQFNSDTGNNYAFRASTNGAADTTTASTNGLILQPSGTAVNQIVNTEGRLNDWSSGVEKSGIAFRITSANGAANVPSRVEQVFKWANTASDITTFEIVRTAGTGSLIAGNSISVWGYS